MINLNIFLLVIIGIIVAIVQSGHAISFNLDNRSPTERFNVHVSFKETCDDILDSLIRENEISSKTHEEKAQAVYDAMIAHSKKTHNPLLTTLSIFEGITTKRLWIANKVYVGHVTVDIIRFIKSLDYVVDIEEERTIQIDPIIRSNPVIPKADGLPWGIKKIGVPTAWSNGATRGKGIRVCTIDTGVRGTHEALKGNFLGTYGWFDPEKKTSKPVDGSGHGTHTMGTICGQTKGIGVAPDIRWMSCKGCGESSCTDTSLIQCGQFVVAPTLTNGSKPNPKLAPHIVSNSWGGGQGSDWYNDVIKAWHAAGIIPVFAIGNSGPVCKSANSPGDQDVIAVGATNGTDKIAFFSSVGPSIEGRIKPDISAPGVSVLSSWNAKDNAYATLDGTSMACPHVAGVIALLKSQNPTLEYNTIKRLLYKGSEKKLPNNTLCGGINKFPNNIYGNGRISAATSASLAKRLTQCEKEVFNPVLEEEEAVFGEIN